MLRQRRRLDARRLQLGNELLQRLDKTGPIDEPGVIAQVKLQEQRAQQAILHGIAQPGVVLAGFLQNQLVEVIKKQGVDGDRARPGGEPAANRPALQWRGDADTRHRQQAGRRAPGFFDYIRCLAAACGSKKQGYCHRNLPRLSL